MCSSIPRRSTASEASAWAIGYQCAMASPEEKRIARGRCTRSLSHHGIRSMRAEMQRLAVLAPDAPPDEYGAGAPVQALEQEVAQLLGKESAVFLAKGVIARLVEPR
jgi:hypothetical protein